MSGLLLVLIVGLFATVFAEFNVDVKNSFRLDGETCGTAKSSDFTKGGETTYGEFPWSVALEYKTPGTQNTVGIKCGGAVINNRFILTAAQCLKLKNVELHSVWLGARKISDADTRDANKVKKFGIEKQILHENYDPYALTNDIALLKLDSNITFSENIGPICLSDEWSSLPSSGSMVTTAGWGQTGLCGPTTDLKLKAQITVYSHADCIDRWNIVVRSDQICTAAESVKSSWRDIGVALMESRPFALEQQWFAIGIVTSNEGCSKDEPVAHTRVSSYAPWIIKKVSRE